MNKPKLRCAIMCRGFVFKAWQAEAIKNLSESGVVDISLLIVDARKEVSNKKNMFQKFFNRNSFYHFYFNRFVNPEAYKPINLSDSLKDIQQIQVEVTENKHREFFPDHAVNEIKNQKIDFILRFGFNILGGEILTAAKYGIWSYHHADENKFRGGPPAFWEIFNDEPVTGVMLQQLTPRLDAGVVLGRNYYMTINHSLKETLNNIFYGAANMPALVAKNLYYNNSFPSVLSTTKARIYTYPGNFKMLLFLARLLINKIKFHFNELTKIEQWNIGVAKQSLHDVMKSGVTSGINYFPLNTRKFFLADPFGIKKENKIFILAEKYDYLKGKADIYSTFYDTQKNLFSPLLPAITSEKHLAYPFMFRVKNNIYCIPESSGNNLSFILNQQALQFEKINIYLPAPDIIDPTFLFYNNYFWLFCTHKSKGSNLNLYIYYSQTLTGPYKNHLLNPVKTDISSARPAGSFFWHENELYRPSQDSSMTYGGRIKLNKIISLTPTEFKEETCTIINPPGKIFNKGIHTFTLADDFIITDSKRYIFSFPHFKRKIIKKFSE